MGVLLETTDGHGFSTGLDREGASFSFRFYLPQPGETKRLTFRLISGPAPPI